MSPHVARGGPELEIYSAESRMQVEALGKPRLRIEGT